MNDNFTGMNPSMVIKEIEEFRNTMSSVSNLFKKAGQNFFGSLRNNWFSPNAVDFGNTYSKPLYEGTVELVEKCTYDLSMDAVDAYNRIASANRMPSINGYNYFTNSMIHEFGSLTEAGSNGQIGMNKSNIINAVNSFVEECGNALSELGNVRSQISLFDRDNSLQTTYANRIKLISETIIEQVNNMINDLSNRFQNEMDIIDQSVANAQDVLSN